MKSGTGSWTVDGVCRLVTCSHCGQRGVRYREVVQWLDLQLYLQLIFSPDWVCRNCIETQKKSPHRPVFRRLRNPRVSPGWANKKAIEAIYLEAERLTRETGIQHHVDHVLPLNSLFISGLHVENNLQILTATENRKKNNRFKGVTAKRMPFSRTKPEKFEALIQRLESNEIDVRVKHPQTLTGSATRKPRLVKRIA